MTFDHEPHRMPIKAVFDLSAPPCRCAQYLQALSRSMLKAMSRGTTMFLGKVERLNLRERLTMW